MSRIFDWSNRIKSWFDSLNRGRFWLVTATSIVQPGTRCSKEHRHLSLMSNQRQIRLQCMFFDNNALIHENLKLKSKWWGLIIACKWDVWWLIISISMSGTCVLQQIHRSQIRRLVLSVICVHKGFIMSDIQLFKNTQVWWLTFRRDLRWHTSSSNFEFLFRFGILFHFKFKRQERKFTFESQHHHHCRLRLLGLWRGRKEMSELTTVRKSFRKPGPDPRKMYWA